MARSGRIERSRKRIKSRRNRAGLMVLMAFVVFFGCVAIGSLGAIVAGFFAWLILLIAGGSQWDKYSKMLEALEYEELTERE